MLIDHWPLLGLRLSSPRLELRLPSEDELGELADLAAGGIHGPDRMPFLVSWPSLPPAERARAVVQGNWQGRASWSPADWSLGLAVFADGQVVGQQGLGTEMRAAVLHLAFAGLGATQATSGAFDDNAPSLRVSAKLGYEPDGIELVPARGRTTTTCRLRLSRARWQARERAGVSITGLAPCLPLFGLPDGREPARDG